MYKALTLRSVENVDMELLAGNFTHFSQKVRPFKHVEICKSAEIQSVSSRLLGGIGPWNQVNEAHFRIYFNPSTTWLVFSTCDTGNKVNQKMMIPIKILGERDSEAPAKMAFWKWNQNFSSFHGKQIYLLSVYSQKFNC